MVLIILLPVQFHTHTMFLNIHPFLSSCGLHETKSLIFVKVMTFTVKVTKLQTVWSALCQCIHVPVLLHENRAKNSYAILTCILFAIMGRYMLDTHN